MSPPGQPSGPQPCNFGFGKCDRTDTHPYAQGARCPDHTPARLAGLPEPDAKRYCLAICYCGLCPHRTKRPIYLGGTNVVDLRAVASGKRRSSLTEYRNARMNIANGAAS